MTNLLNEEIMAIKCTIAHLRKGAILEPDSTKRNKMESNIKELNKLLNEKLEQCGDFHG